MFCNRNFRHGFQGNTVNSFRHAGRSEINLSCRAWYVWRPSPAYLYLNLTGAVETAVKLASWGRVTLNLVSKGGGVATEAIESMKFLKIGGNVLIAVGVLVDAALLIAEAIQGAEQRADLQK